MWRKRNSRAFTAKAIREAIDSYPGGLCLSTEDGKPILVNGHMNRLIREMTGHTVIEANSTWNMLLHTESCRGCVKLHTPWLEQDADEIGEHLVFQFPDRRIWRFHRAVLGDEQFRTVQLDATDMTELYHMSKQLWENNRRLAKMHERQQALLTDIMQINKDKELLSAKMRVHDDLGRCLVATKKAMQEPMSPDEAEKLMNGWKVAIRDMSNIPLQGAESSPVDELMKVAELIGCHVDFIGEMPKEHKVVLLLISAVREALTNAVRHAGADRLTVDMQQIEKRYHIVITSNGKVAPKEIQEGDGLGSLRRSLEQEGAVLDVRCENSVVLYMDIPQICDKGRRRKAV